MTDSDSKWLLGAALAGLAVPVGELLQRAIVAPAFLKVLCAIAPETSPTMMQTSEGLREGIDACQVLLRLMIYANATMEAVPGIEGIADRILSGGRVN